MKAIMLRWKISRGDSLDFRPDVGIRKVQKKEKTVQPIPSKVRR
jgi:hypothetical protein